MSSISVVLSPSWLSTITLHGLDLGLPWDLCNHAYIFFVHFFVWYACKQLPLLDWTAFWMLAFLLYSELPSPAVEELWPCYRFRTWAVRAFACTSASICFQLGFSTSLTSWFPVAMAVIHWWKARWQTQDIKNKQLYTKANNKEGIVESTLGKVGSRPWLCSAAVSQL